MEKALDQIDGFVKSGNRVNTVFAVNPEKNFSVPKNRALYKTFKHTDLLIPDGIGMVLAAKVLYGAGLQRVPGCELMQNICGLAEQKGYKIFIYGAKEEVSQSAVQEIMRRHPSIKIVGRQNGYLEEGRMEELIQMINDSRAQILFLALGSPRQELWLTRYKVRLTHVRVCQGIGGTLDVLAGTVKRAPEIYCKLGLEWLYRLFSEPSRIKRQLKLPFFAAQVLAAKLNR
jgi:N-acetylglucosaminyldiphosphoundecaprenol N-acetyl-beta-D-mannosaminyltransferase